MPVLVLRGVSKRFDQRRWVLRQVSLQVETGERVVLIGESGVGKSSLLNLCAGLDVPDEGEIVVAGRPLHGLDDTALAAVRRRSLGFVFQAFHLIPHLQLWQNVALPLLLIGADEASARENARAMLDEVGLGERADSLPGELSGGEQQRVALARALVHRPALILADEPTGNLDPQTAAAATNLLAEQVRTRSASLLMVTHSAQAERNADRVLRLTPEGVVPA
ncbi:MAG: ABC transporter ATP-binding protein [Lautropia sp.]|nr:ABC transporter ATP-binding protein [Lautropia sp.]